MDILFVTLALLLPVLLGGLWLNLLVPVGFSGRTALVWGSGTLLGLIAITGLMQLVNALGQPLEFGNIALIAIVLSLPAGLASFKRQRAHKSPPHLISSTRPDISAGARSLFWLMLAILAFRAGTLGLELFWRPLFPWDATMHWATKSRVWFEHRSMIPFATNTEWLRAGGEGLYTDRHPSYPAMIPLLQVWMSLATDRWDESLMNLPWLLAYVALGCAFFGQLRRAGVNSTIAIVFTYLLLSQPLLNTHVALAGYADLFLGATYCGALMALHNWSVTRQPWQGALALLFAGACFFIKNEGAIWPLTLIPAIAAAFLARREAAKLFILLCLIALLLWLVVPKSWIIAGISLNQLQPTFHPDALNGVFVSVFIHDSWHLFGYMLIALVPLSLLMPGALTRTFLPLTVSLASCVGLFLFLFLFTGFGWGAANFTAVGRLSIQLVPGLVFLAALLFNELLNRGGLRLPARPSAQQDVL